MSISNWIIVGFLGFIGGITFALQKRRGKLFQLLVKTSLLMMRLHKQVRLLPRWQAFLLVTILFAVAACREGVVKSAPPELVDTWVSNHPRYQGLYLKIAQEKFEYSTAAGTVEAFVITEYLPAKNPKQSQPQRHTLNGKRGEQTLTLNLVLDPRDGGVLTFVNRPHIMWMRQQNLPKQP
jgi:hypothetical protein